MIDDAVWDDALGTAGGPQFGAALAAFAADRSVAMNQLARAAGVDEQSMEEIVRGGVRVGTAPLARMIVALRSKPIEFMQKTGFLSLAVYASGLDPLYFLPEGPVRYDARIYMREINPRHAVPEADMTRRNPTIKAIGEDDMLETAGKIEMELAYLLRLAADGARAKE